MECSVVYVTPKKKLDRNTACSPSDASPVEKRAKESNSPVVTSPGDEDEVMAALKLSEGVAEKFDLILAKLCSLDTKMEDLNTTVKSLQSKLSSVEIDMDNVKVKQNSTFVDERINQLQSNLEKSKREVDECHQKILYLEAYSRRENLKFEGIAEASQNNATATQSENTEDALVDFIENVLGIEDAKNIEFQRIHRLGKPNSDSGVGGRTIIARFLRFSDRERVFKQGRKLKGTNYRMFEDIPKELQKRKTTTKREKHRWED